MNTNSVRKSLWFITGLGIGAGTTWFVATRSGQRAQKKLLRMAEDGRERVAEASRECLDKGKEMIGHGKEMAEDTLGWVGEKLHVAGGRR